MNNSSHINLNLLKKMLLIILSVFTVFVISSCKDKRRLERTVVTVVPTKAPEVTKEDEAASKERTREFLKTQFTIIKSEEEIAAVQIKAKGASHHGCTKDRAIFEYR